MSGKSRLEVEVFARGLAASREKAQAYILAGDVYLNGQRARKPSAPVQGEDTIELRGAEIPYVSRGGLKLEKGIQVFGLELGGKNCIDVGASTGGFTDCMLQNGADFVYAIDVGYGQLDWRLRNDPRVAVMERRNARYMQKDWFDKAITFASMDVSFISIALILPGLYDVLEEKAEVMALVKPQFEAGREQVGKNGVVRDEAVHFAVLQKSIRKAREIGYVIKGLNFSPITGPQGNIEFLLHMQKGDLKEENPDEELLRIRSCVAEAHAALKGS